MANRQYIGARYVPKLMGDWAENTFYEGLSIVTYNNVSYTSKKPVPATVGNPAENPEYWVATGNYSAQMAQIIEDVNTLSGNVSNISDNLDVLTTRVNHIPTLLQNKNLFVVGDSWGAGFTDSTGTGFVAELDDRNIFKSVNNYSLGGIGYVAANGTTTLLTKLQEIESDYSDRLDEVNIIIVEGGVNDYRYSDVEITTAARTFYNYAKEHFPNAEIYAVANIVAQRSISNFNKSEIPLSVASECGCIPLYWPHRMLYGHETQFTGDKWHITHTACIYYANNIINNILGYFAFEPDGVDISTTLGSSTLESFSSTSQKIEFNGRYVDLCINDMAGIRNTSHSVPLFMFNENYLPSVSYGSGFSISKPTFIIDKPLSEGSNVKYNNNEFTLLATGGILNIYDAANFNASMVMGNVRFRFDRLARVFV